VSAVGKSDFYYLGDDAISIARNSAKDKLYGLCKKKGLKFYPGKYEKDPIGNKSSLVTFSDLKCKEKEERKNCSVKAEGICIAKETEYFSLSCGKGKKKIVGRSEIIRGGHLRVTSETGTVYTINKDTMLSEGLTQKGRMAPLLDIAYGTFCPKVKDKPKSLITKFKGYMRSQLEIHQKNCKEIISAAQNDKEKRIPEGCKSGASIGSRG